MILHLLKKRVAYIFPAFLFALLVIFTITKISGTSVGVLNSMLFGQSHKQDELIANHPRPIRSDEWGVNTPLTVSQAKNGFPRVNNDVGNGHDMSIVVDAPYREWSTLFKPQNWVFFVLPLENAFAFRWWFQGFMLIMACYLFCLALLPRKYAVAVLISLGLFFSPFVQWWYLYGTLGSIYLALLSAVVLTKIIQTKRKEYKLLWGALLAYLLTCFALVLYPPYQIPCALAVAVFFVGYMLDSYTPKRRRDLLKSLLYVAGAVTTAGLVVLLFLKTRSGVIEVITNTVYPGKRDIVSGGLNSLHVFGNHLSPLLQSDRLSANYYANQSEASGFIFIFPFLFLLSAYLLIRRWLVAKKIDWLLLVTNLALVVSLARVFLPGLNLLYKPFMLHVVPHERLMIGVGLLAFMQIIMLIRHWYLYKPMRNHWIIGVSAVVTFISFYHTGMYVMANYPAFLNEKILVIASAFAMALIVFLMCVYRFTWALLVLLGFSLLSVYRVNPLYRGLSPVVNSDLTNAIQEVGDSKGKWVVSEDVAFESIIPASGVQALSGVYTYPQLDLWKPLEQSPQDKDIYNRYAHVFFTVEKIDLARYPIGAYLDPPAVDAFRVHADPCSNFLKQHNVSYIITSHDKKGLDCLKEIRQIPYPSLNFRIYRIL